MHLTDLKDTFHFVEQIKSVDLSTGVMVSFDVKSLFTNVPLQETIDVCLDRLYRSDRMAPPAVPEHVLRNLIELCVCENLFVFDGKVYAQVDGVAMGNSLGPILANIWMTHLEETYMFNSMDMPRFYRRYVDDTFCVFDSREQAESFLLYINDGHPSIQFEIEYEANGKISFLDTIVHRTGDPQPTLSTKVKETDRGLFYHFDSFVPSKYKSNLVFTLVYRLYMIASNMTIFHSDLTSLTNRLVKNGFPRNLIHSCVEKVLNKFHAGIIHQPDDADSDKRDVKIFLPYLGHMSYVLKRDIIRLVQKFYPRIKIIVVFRRGTKISNMFARKDKFPLSCQSGVIYHISCKACGPSAAYLGKTINSLYERFHDSSTGHLGPSNTDSALLNHINFSGNPDCGFNFKDIKILDRCKRDEQLRFIESILLKLARAS